MQLLVAGEIRLSFEWAAGTMARAVILVEGIYYSVSIDYYPVFGPVGHIWNDTQQDGTSMSSAFSVAHSKSLHKKFSKI
jgi:hypothetical protein